MDPILNDPAVQALADAARLLSVAFPPAPAYARHPPRWRPDLWYLLKRRAAQQARIDAAKTGP